MVFSRKKTSLGKANENKMILRFPSINGYLKIPVFSLSRILLIAGKSIPIVSLFRMHMTSIFSLPSLIVLDNEASNEHSNGLLGRNRLPKQMNFIDVSQQFLSTVADKWNRIPRKSLNYQTSYKVLLGFLKKSSIV